MAEPQAGARQLRVKCLDLFRVCRIPQPCGFQGPQLLQPASTAHSDHRSVLQQFSLAVRSSLSTSSVSCSLPAGMPSPQTYCSFFHIRKGQRASKHVRLFSNNSWRDCLTPHPAGDQSEGPAESPRPSDHSDHCAGVGCRAALKTLKSSKRYLCAGREEGEEGVRGGGG